jgi:diguanylate cyclase (GGDEF)-like protein
MNSILIVDDQKTVGLSLALTLRHHGYFPRLVTSGQEALEITGREDWRLVITDWIMPGIDGLELCRRIRTRRHGLYSYIIMLTSRSGRSERLEGLEAGADDFLSKPVDEDELLVRLRIAQRILGIQAELEEKNALLNAMANSDPLTGLANRRQLHESVAAALSETRGGVPSSFVAVDIDNFKSYNDVFGHAAGDEVLCTVADILRGAVRKNDLVVRTGGEEFVIVLPGLGADDALAVAERLRKAIESHSWPRRQVTASFGVSTAAGPQVSSSAVTLLERADRALYHSKHSGRNNVSHFRCLADAVPSTLTHSQTR